jgi:hypothetical protein
MTEKPLPIFFWDIQTRSDISHYFYHGSGENESPRVIPEPLIIPQSNLTHSSDEIKYTFTFSDWTATNEYGGNSHAKQPGGPLYKYDSNAIGGRY